MRPAARDVGAILPWLLLLAGLGGFAWLTRHPDTALVGWALDKPILADAAQAFRDRWGPHPEPASSEILSAAEPSPARRDSPRIERVPLDARPRVWAAAATPVYTRPDPRADVAHHLVATRSLPYLTRQGAWFHVRTASFEGWIELPGYDEIANPPWGSGRRPSTAGPGSQPDPALLAAAEELLGPALSRGELGPFALLTDVDDEALLGRMETLASGLEDAFAARFGLAPRVGTVATVILFRRETGYRRFQSLTPQLADLPATGHAGGGLVALFADRQSSAEVEAALLHELTHEVARRAVGPALPAWLAEGLADELAQSRWQEDGTLVPGSLAGERRLLERRREPWRTRARQGVRIEESYELTGGRAALATGQEALDAGRLLPLADLTALAWPDFVGASMGLHYAESFLFIRFLLGDSRRAPRFQAFLADVAAGSPASGEALRSRLGVSWDELDTGFRSWLAARSL